MGFPGETEDDVEDLVSFLEEVELDWAGFFPYSAEAGTPAAELADQIPAEAVGERLRHLQSCQDAITDERNRFQIGRRTTVLVDQIEDGTPVARSFRHAPEIDGVITLDAGRPGEWRQVEITAAFGSDLEAEVVSERVP